MNGCRMEIVYLDPTAYAAVASHGTRQAILTTLFRKTRLGDSITKQELADAVGLKYQQLAYQLANHLRDFWTVVNEEKIRGATREYIAPADPDAVYICLGKDRRVFIVDPIAGIFGPLSEVGLRCDSCTVDEADACVRSLVSDGTIPAEMGSQERETLSLNKRSGMRPLDRGIIESLRGIATGTPCVLTLPRGHCGSAGRTEPADE